jgi:hypothetical protein
MHVFPINLLVREYDSISGSRHGFMTKTGGWYRTHYLGTCTWHGTIPQYSFSGLYRTFSQNRQQMQTFKSA